MRGRAVIKIASWWWLGCTAGAPVSACSAGPRCSARVGGQPGRGRLCGGLVRCQPRPPALAGARQDQGQPWAGRSVPGRCGEAADGVLEGARHAQARAVREVAADDHHADRQAVG